eukprot:gene23943-biopygen13412
MRLGRGDNHKQGSQDTDAGVARAIDIFGLGWRGHGVHGPVTQALQSEITPPLSPALCRCWPGLGARSAPSYRAGGETATPASGLRPVQRPRPFSQQYAGMFWGKYAYA